MALTRLPAALMQRYVSQRTFSGSPARPHKPAPARIDPIKFISEVLVNPETRAPFVLLPAEKAFLAKSFETTPDGRLAYPEQIYAAPKKSGKTTFAAIHMITTLVLFGGRYAEGYAVANDLEQAQSRVFETARRIIEASPLLKHDCKVTSDKITFSNKATITPLARDSTSAAGAHPVISVFDELWGYISERARRLWDEMVPVPTRATSLRLVVTYAGFERHASLPTSLRLC